MPEELTPGSVYWIVGMPVRISEPLAANMCRLMARSQGQLTYWTIPGITAALESQGATETSVAFTLNAYSWLFTPVERVHHYAVFWTLPDALKRLEERGVPVSSERTVEELTPTQRLRARMCQVMSRGQTGAYWTKHSLTHHLQETGHLGEGEAALIGIENCLEGAPRLFKRVPPLPQHWWTMACTLEEAYELLGLREPPRGRVVVGRTAWERLLGGFDA